MDTLTLLQNRRSNKKLQGPAPDERQLEAIFKAAFRAPDHGKLQPYHFTVIQGEGLADLETLLKAAVEEFNLGEERLQKATNFARRAPMVIAVVAKINQEVKKVPGWEQMLTAGCATYGIQLAAAALGFESFWATGPLVEGSALREALGCEPHDKVVALLQLGTAAEVVDKSVKETAIEDFVEYWD